MNTYQRDEHGMVTVIAAADGVRDNGHTYAKGQTFHLHEDLVPSHVATGQIRLPEPALKIAEPAQDKQVKTTARK